MRFGGVTMTRLMGRFHTVQPLRCPRHRIFISPPSLDHLDLVRSHQWEQLLQGHWSSRIFWAFISAPKHAASSGGKLGWIYATWSWWSNSHLFSPQVAQIGSVTRSAEKGAGHLIFSYRILFPFMCGNKSDINLISANACVVQADRLDIPWHWESDNGHVVLTSLHMITNTTMMLMGSLLSLSHWKSVGIAPLKRF